MVFGGTGRHFSILTHGARVGIGWNERPIGNKNQILFDGHKGENNPILIGRKEKLTSQHHIPGQLETLSLVFCTF